MMKHQGNRGHKPVVTKATVRAGSKMPPMMGGVGPMVPPVSTPGASTGSSDMAGSQLLAQPVPMPPAAPPQGVAANPGASMPQSGGFKRGGMVR